jgi:hypothetical protein
MRGQVVFHPSPGGKRIEFPIRTCTSFDSGLELAHQLDRASVTTAARGACAANQRAIPEPARVGECLMVAFASVQGCFILGSRVGSA